MYGGLALLHWPSKALQDTVKLMSASPGHTSAQATLPVLDFVAQRHDLDSLRNSMELALRKASCRVFAMEVRILKMFIARVEKKLVKFFESTEFVMAATKCCPTDVPT